MREERERVRRGVLGVGPTARPEIPVRLYEAVGARELLEVDHGHVVGAADVTNLIELKQLSPKHSHDAVRLVGVKT
jgi:hypothetical protein